ncbi:MAG: M56 family metallopeptidase [Fimbriimonadaceae bacterium]|nr:M56 family metallopeptidase [Fimbriimonadaceae bacterium]
MIEPSLLLERLIWTCVQGSILLALVWFITSRAAFSHPRLRSILWSIAFLHLIIGLAVSLPLPILPEANTGTLIISKLEGQPSDTLLMQNQPTASADREKGGLPSWLMLLWVVGALTSVTLLTYREFRFKRGMQSASIAEPSLNSLVEKIAHQVGLRRTPKIIVSEEIKTPCVSGVIQPVICWPQSLIGSLDQAREEAILVHEMTHIKHGDLIVGWLAAFSGCLFFFNPLVWLSRCAFASQSELLCDREVLRITNIGRKAYCELLIHVACKRPYPPSTVYSVTREFKSLSQRIENMNSRSIKSRGAASISLVSATVLALLVAIPISATPRKATTKPDDSVIMVPQDAISPVSPISAEEVPTIILDPDQLVNIEMVGSNEPRDLVLDQTLTLSYSDIQAGALLKIASDKLGVKVDPGVIDGLHITAKFDKISLRTLLDVLSKSTGVKWTHVSEREFRFEG